MTETCKTVNLEALKDRIKTLVTVWVQHSSKLQYVIIDDSIVPEHKAVTFLLACSQPIPNDDDLLAGLGNRLAAVERHLHAGYGRINIGNITVQHDSWGNLLCCIEQVFCVGGTVT